MSLETRLRQILAADPWRMAALGVLSQVCGPDFWVSAGFVRNAVWDHLHGFAEATPLNDIDVVYFDPARPDPACETSFEAKLDAVLPAPWSVTNQARMHLAHGDLPYRSLEDAMRYWLETPTAIAARRADHGIEILAPFGFDDLFALRVAPTPHAVARRLDDYRRRVLGKNWPTNWPRVSVNLY